MKQNNLKKPEATNWRRWCLNFFSLHGKQIAQIQRLVTCHSTTSTVKGHELVVASTSVSGDWRESSFMKWPWDFINEVSIARADLIHLSWTPLMWVAADVFFIIVSRSFLTISRKQLKFCRFVSINVF